MSGTGRSPELKVSSAAEIQQELRQLRSVEAAAHAQRFFKTGPGQYGEGDVFLGIRVPVLRKLARKYRDLSIGQTLRLLRSGFHEERLLALFIMADRFKRATADERETIYILYLKNTRYINNWDLVDCSAEHIVGAHLWEKSRTPLYDLARSIILWERRVAVISTFHFIKRNEFSDTLKIATILLYDPEDLIHKAVGWMLREVGKRNVAALDEFLLRHYGAMPRTMLRYAIERFPEDKRQRYLKGTAF